MKFLPVILILGKDGQIGWELQRSLSCLGKLYSLGRNDLDICDSISMRKIFAELKPDVVVNAAAYTAVDKAENEPELAARLNADAPAILADESLRADALLVHYSTDYVFDGKKDGYYSEDDQPNPVNVYGRTKYQGEQNIQSSGVDYLIFRTSWIYSLTGSNFLLTMLKLARMSSDLTVVSDQVGAPTWARIVAIATCHAVLKSHIERTNNTFESGIYHLVSEGETSWYYFAEEIMRTAKSLFPEEFVNELLINPISTANYPALAERPLNSRLQTKRFQRKFNVYMPEWRLSLKQCMAEMRVNSSYSRELC